MSERDTALAVLESLIRTGIPISMRLRDELSAKVGTLDFSERDRLRAALAERDWLDERDRQAREQLRGVSPGRKP